MYYSGIVQQIYYYMKIESRATSCAFSCFVIFFSACVDHLTKLRHVLLYNREHDVMQEPRKWGVGEMHTPTIIENFSLLPTKRGKFFSKFYAISLKNSYTFPFWDPRAATDIMYLIHVITHSIIEIQVIQKSLLP